jgi:SHS2 domain-containing protein
MPRSNAGFEEIEHTADWALKVWAPDLPALFEQAALGMDSLAGIELDGESSLDRRLELKAPDAESLLVAFLSEVLHFAESEQIGFRSYSIRITSERLTASLEGAPILQASKEIKAVTYHQLAIKATPYGLETQIVFDV